MAGSISIFDDLFIFEMANNHQGDTSHAKYIIDKLSQVAFKYNINAAVKFQYRDLDTFIHPDFKTRTDVKHIPRFISTRLDADVFFELVSYAKSRGLLVISTPFDEKSVDVCCDHGIDVIKVASCSANDWPLLEEIAKANRPIIVSTGGQSFEGMDNIYNFFFHKNCNFAMLHCVGIYPPTDEQFQLKTIERMRNRYPNITVGYSGHESPEFYLVSQLAIAKGAKILERHVGHKTDKISLNAYSTEVDDIGGWIEAVQQAKALIGSDKKRLFIEETKSLEELSRGTFAARDIKKGEIIERDDVYFAMPISDGQVSSGQFKSGYMASDDYSANTPLKETYPVTESVILRSAIHDVKSMLFEAKIVIANEFELELSHHFGREHFRHYGITIISIVNREYCKKLIIVLPGQQNPTHFHKEKEETFHILYGDLRLILADGERVIHPGEICTIERGVKHAFSSAQGCIFEEVSTTHVRNDSFYEDKRIAGMDPMSRKTILKDW